MKEVPNFHHSEQRTEKQEDMAYNSLETSPKQKQATNTQQSTVNWSAKASTQVCPHPHARDELHAFSCDGDP